MPLDASAARSVPARPMSGAESVEEQFRSGFVALIGRPNAGKSTLLNRLVGEHVAIVAATPQTTRHQIRGVMNLDGAQVVFVDTPGLHKPKDPLSESLNRRVTGALRDVDVICHLVDASVVIGSGDAFVANAIRSVAKSAPCLLLLTKVDLVEGGPAAASAAAQRAGLTGYDEVLPISAVAQVGLDETAAAIVSRLPEGPAYYPSEMTTDQPLAQRVGEMVREAVLARVREELPYEVAVQVTEIAKRPKGRLTDIEATVVVDRESQKGIIIGKGGATLVAIGTAARPAIEELVGGPVYLRLSVRTRRHWRQDASLIKRFGYSDG